MVSKSLHIIKSRKQKPGINNVISNMDRIKNTSFRMKISDDEIVESGLSPALFGAGMSEEDFNNYYNENNNPDNPDAEYDITTDMDRLDTSESDVDLSNVESNVDRHTGLGPGAGELVIGNTVARQNNYSSFDPRIAFFDGFVSKENAVVPFATDTAASAYYDMVFTIEKAVYDAGNKNNSGSSSTPDGVAHSNTSGDDVNQGNRPKTGDNMKDTDRVAPNDKDVNRLRANGDNYGVASLVNSYTLTRLIGGLRGGAPESFTNHMYDIRDIKRFYDNGIVTDDADFTSITNPTTTNIIEWSNKDNWGRTPYKFTDFVFCKYWNVIPNNRLLTLRKYAVPVYDNLNFPNMFLDDKGQQPNPETNAAPIATVVSYFDGESANKLNDFIKFSTGTKWKNVDADIHNVTGDEGSNPRAVIDEMFERGGFGGVNAEANIVNKVLGTSGGVTGKIFSFGKFVGLISPPNGYNGHNQAAWDKLKTTNIDPREQLYSNKIAGPVNRVMSTKARDAGIEFSQTFNLVCEYIARPIGGVNTKAAMLDILANCMEIASPDAVWWGGGYRFMIEPHMYPFKREDFTNTMMEDLYAGKIFGKDGAIAHGLEGMLNLGKKDGSSSFEWSNVTSSIGTVISQTIGAIGNMLQSISSSLFGETSTLSGWLKKGTDALSDPESQKKGTERLNEMFKNLNLMWKDQVIQ